MPFPYPLEQVVRHVEVSEFHIYDDTAGVIASKRNAGLLTCPASRFQQQRSGNSPLTEFGANLQPCYVPSSLAFQALNVQTDGKLRKTENLFIGILAQQDSHRFFESAGEKRRNLPSVVSHSVGP